MKPPDNKEEKDLCLVLLKQTRILARYRYLRYCPFLWQPQPGDFSFFLWYQTKGFSAMNESDGNLLTGECIPDFGDLKHIKEA